MVGQLENVMYPGLHQRKCAERQCGKALFFSGRLEAALIVTHGRSESCYELCFVFLLGPFWVISKKSKATSVCAWMIHDMWLVSRVHSLNLEDKAGNFCVTVFEMLPFSPFVIPRGSFIAHGPWLQKRFGAILFGNPWCFAGLFASHISTLIGFGLRIFQSSFILQNLASRTPGPTRQGFQDY